MSQAVVDALTSKFSDGVTAETAHGGDEAVVVDVAKLVEVATFLRDDPKLAFDSPVFVTAIDRLGQTDGPRYEVVYQLRSFTQKHRIRLKTLVDGDEPKVPSLSSVWPGLNWQERETYDMYGIHFAGHPDLRRIFMYEEFVGYPLRKDYPKDKRQPLARRDWDNE